MHERSSGRRRRMSIGTGSIALSLGLCLCAGQLVATPAASAASVPVQAAAVAKVKPRLSVSYSKRTAGYGSPVRVTTKLVDPRTNKALVSGTVRLQAYRGGTWKTWVIRSNNRQGKVTFSTTPRVTGYLRTTYSGTTGVSSGATSAVKITVKNSGAKVLAEAKKHKGALYLFAAAGPKRFDCSGFTMYVYKKAIGKKLPHKANSQQKYGKAVSKSGKRIGDLIVFRSGSYGYHAAVYAGGGYMWDSPHSGARVGKHKMHGSNYVVRRLV